RAVPGQVPGGGSRMAGARGLAVRGGGRGSRAAEFEGGGEEGRGLTPPFRNVDPLLEGLEPTRPAEALLVQRAGLIRILRNSLGEQHDHRRQVARAPAEAETCA